MEVGTRFYDSSKGSFIQQDRYMGDPSDPLSLNKYVYCQLDPVKFVDPTGFKQIVINGTNSTKITKVSSFTITKFWASVANIGLKFGIGVGTTMATEGVGLSVWAARLLGGATALIPEPEVKPGDYTVTTITYVTEGYAIVVREITGPEGSVINGTSTDVYNVDSAGNWSYNPPAQSGYEMEIEY